MMKQRQPISRNPLFWGLFFLLFFASQRLMAQEDSTRTLRDSTQLKLIGGFDEMIKPLPEDSYPLRLNPPRPVDRSRMPTYSFSNELHLPYYVDRNPLFRGDFSTSGVLWQSRHGAIYGTGGQETVPGIGRFNEASVGYSHIFNDRFALQVGVDAMKINRINFVGETFGTSGRLSYQATDRLGFNVFGTYNIGNTYGMSTDRYGASVSLMMSDRFRMEVGAQRVYNAMTGRWETIPVAIPTYRFDNGFELGLDVGAIIYEILRNTSIGNGQRREGPTIAPPRLEMPMR